ncbi:MAG TPA: TadE family protein [Ilumatobacteraceae bacterium]|nr:TadE family protein [Ilumatobacteraceae bacterium]
MSGQLVRPPGARDGQQRRGRSANGQAAVEFALVLPVVVMMAFGLVIVGVAVRNELAVELAAREGARAAAVSASPANAATAAATRAVRLPIDVATTSGAATVTVTVTHVDAIDVAIIGTLIGPITHTASVTMAIEPP